MTHDTPRPALLDTRRPPTAQDATAILRMLTSDLPEALPGCRADGFDPQPGH